MRFVTFFPENNLLEIIAEYCNHYYNHFSLSHQSKPMKFVSSFFSLSICFVKILTYHILPINTSPSSFYLFQKLFKPVRSAPPLSPHPKKKSPFYSKNKKTERTLGNIKKVTSNFDSKFIKFAVWQFILKQNVPKINQLSGICLDF